MPKSIPQAPEILRQPSTEGSKLVKLLPLIIVTAILSAAISAGGVYWWLASRASGEVDKQPTQAESLPGEQSEGEQAATEALERLFEETLEGDYTGWEMYTDADFGLAFMYPVNCSVVEPSDTSVEIEGRLNEEGNHWPVFSVGYHDSELYQPPEGVSLNQWLVDNDPLFAKALSEWGDSIGSSVAIAGYPAVHIVSRSHPHGVDRDGYYFVHSGQMYNIVILHVGGHTDWDLYNKFLNSFTFF